ncbi:MAG: inositol monophosphatase [Bdellovibrionales bacterium]|nr:inositol monophosphatase [Bdellovibrionales bacterium]
MKDLDLTQALGTALKAAKAGRQVLLDYFGRLKKVQEKAHAGLVSEADVESEKVISAILKKDFPDIAVLGEEGAFLSKDDHVQRSSWVVDPLDGTTNYVHGFHIFNISIGLQWQGELVAGVVDVPLLDKTYTAAKGQGAFVNGQPIHVSQRKTIKEALLATGFFPDNTTALKTQLKIFSDIVYDARGVRRAGAAAYDLALVAEGVFDAFWEPNLKPWDAAAGTVLVREAGGVVWDYSGSEYKLGDNTLLAGNRELADELVQRIRPLRA